MIPLTKFHLGDDGFTLVELLVGTVVSLLVLGGAVALSSQVESGYRRQIESAAAEQEGRYALEWIGKYVRSAGNNPTTPTVTTSQCPVAATPFAAVDFDPLDLENDTIRLMTDANPPDGLIGGAGLVAGDCNQANEDVTISFDDANNAILFLDNNVGVSASIRTDAVIEDLRFIYRNNAGTVITNPANVFYVETQITVRTRTVDGTTGQPLTRTLSSIVRVRSR